MTRPVSSGEAVFVSGSTLRHVAVMTATASVGLVAVFVVDLLSLLYVSRLGRPEATAGVGYATIVLYIMVSFNVGLMIAVTALTARALGARDREGARRIAASSLAVMTAGGLLLGLLMLPLLPWLLPLLGARGEALAIATSFLWITLPANMVMALGMGLSGILRAAGDARRAMYVTLAGAVVTAGLDPLLIFGAGLGPDGAAWATALSRIVFVVIGWHGVVRVHRLLTRPTLAALRQDLRPTAAIAAPAIMTNLANPLANACFFAIIARFGDQVVAASAIVDRLVPVAFGVLFALSGAVGPIIAQNWGASRYDRMRRALTDAVCFVAIYVVVASLLLFLLRHQVPALFGATGRTAELVTFFCLIAGPMWLFIGALFVATAAFNNLGMPLHATALSWGRATLGTVPLAWLGAHLGGPEGAMLGTVVGAVVAGSLALALAYRAIDRLARRASLA